MEAEEEERTAAAEAVEAREPGVFKLGGGETPKGVAPPNTHRHTHTHIHTHVADDGQIHHGLTPERHTWTTTCTQGGVQCVGGEVRLGLVSSSI